MRERFFVLLAPCILFSRCSWGSPHFVDGAWGCGRPPVSRRERADHSGYLPVKRSPLTNTDETREICSESAQFAQTVYGFGEQWKALGRFWLGLQAPDGGESLTKGFDLYAYPAERSSFD